MKRTDQRLREIALAWVEGRMYCSHNVPKDLLTVVFMPLGLMTAGEARKLARSKPVEVFAIVGEHEAVRGRAVNGYPFFAACEFIGRREWRKVCGYAEDFRQRRAEMLGNDNPNNQSEDRS